MTTVSGALQKRPVTVGGPYKAKKTQEHIQECMCH